MNSKIFQTTSRNLALNSSRSGHLSNFHIPSIIRRLGYDWGHETVEEKEAKHRKAEQMRVNKIFLIFNQGSPD